MKNLRIALVAALVLVTGGYASAQLYPAVKGDVTDILGSAPLFPYGARMSQLNQYQAGNYAIRAALATGVYTYTFPAAYNSAPICTGSEESTTGHYVKITAISATAVTMTSDVTTSNSDPVDIVCVGNPS